MSVVHYASLIGKDRKHIPYSKYDDKDFTPKRPAEELTPEELMQREYLKLRSRRQRAKLKLQRQAEIV